MTPIEVFNLFLEDTVSYSGDKYVRLKSLNISELKNIIDLRSKELENAKRSQDQNS